MGHYIPSTNRCVQQTMFESVYSLIKRVFAGEFLPLPQAEACREVNKHSHRLVVPAALNHCPGTYLTLESGATQQVQQAALPVRRQWRLGDLAEEQAGASAPAGAGMPVADMAGDRRAGPRGGGGDGGREPRFLPGEQLPALDVRPGCHREPAGGAADLSSPAGAAVRGAGTDPS